MKEVQLNRGYVAVVDDEDYDRVSQYVWHVRTHRNRQIQYAVRVVRTSAGRKWELLHNFIMGETSTNKIDHINRDGLDCRKRNLRSATQSQNLANSVLRGLRSSQYRGVTFHSSRGKWTAQIGVNGKSRYLGVFSVEEDAAQAYDRAAIDAFGEFASLNFPRNRPSWADIWLRTAVLISFRGTCLRAKVGAVIVTKSNLLVATGYNGAAKKQPHCEDVGCLLGPDGTCRRTLHAEVNAIVQAGPECEGSTIYSTCTPCLACATLIVQAGLSKVVAVNEYHDIAGVNLLEQAGVQVVRLEPSKIPHLSPHEKEA